MNIFNVFPAETLLTMERQHCSLCWIDGQRTRLGGPEILKGADLQAFGQARYRRQLRAALLQHIAAMHQEYIGKVR